VEGREEEVKPKEGVDDVDGKAEALWVEGEPNTD